jgi:eukaryotic-like serine/threonine-protein kinase
MPVDAQRAQAIFAAAIELSQVSERAALLDRECGGDVELRRRVEILLAAHDDSAGLPAADSHGTGAFVPSAKATELASGTLFAGRYKIREKLGEGGMGTVYVADQTEPVQRRIALKIIKTDIASDRLLARFEQERQALALMDHPNIAKVLDAGVSDSTPYFAMELIKGVPITKYCDETRLTPKQRLELFIPVCQAVQHAHQKGIIHRDLKPSNILIGLYDGRAVPKVIDFGVAKATGAKLTDQSVYTEVGSLIGTLEYMSPEQAELNNLDIDTRSDIYALGVVLYELLTGTVPHSRKELKSAGFAEMLRAIKEVEPPKPSTRLSGSGSLPAIAALRHTEPRKLTALLRNDLDWIVMKALEKDRSRRYETANGFAMDIQCYLADEPVLAGPPSAGYRLRKFVKRNKAQVVAALLVLFALTAGIAGTTIGLIRAEKQRLIAEEKEHEAIHAAEEERHAKQRESAQRAKAEKAGDRTREVLDAMVSEVTGDSLATQKAISDEQKKFLQGVLGYYREFAGENADDQLSRSRHARAAGRVGTIEYRLGRKEESAAAVRIARDGYASLAAEFPDVPEYRQGLATNHNNLGNVLAGLGKRPEAEEQYRKGLSIQEKLAADFPAVPTHRQDLAMSHNNLGFLLAGLGKRPEAEEQYRKALSIQEKLAADFPTVPEYRQDLAKCHNNLGILLADLGKRPKAEEQYREGRSIFEKLAADFPTVPEYRLELAISHINLGLLLTGLGKLPLAEEQYRKGQSILEKLAADFPAVPEYRQDLAKSHNSLGLLLAGLGKRPEAEEQYRKAVSIQEKLAADFPAVPAYQVELGGSCCNYGNLKGEDRKLAESLEWFDKAIRVLKPVHEKEPRDVTAQQYLRNSYWMRARAFDLLQKFAEAVKDCDRAIELSPPMERPGLRVQRINSRLQAGQVGEAIAEAAELTKSSGWHFAQLYDFACIYAIASGKIADKKQEYADRAMEMLQKAVKAGYKDAAHMKKDTDLDPLRGREDFKKLLAELETKAEKPRVTNPMPKGKQ